MKTLSNTYLAILWSRQYKMVLTVLFLVIMAGIILLVFRGRVPDILPVDVTVPIGPSAYRLVPDWPQFPTAAQVGVGAGVTVDNEGHVFFLHRAGHSFFNTTVITRPLVLELDPLTGTVLSSWGSDLFQSPHGLAIDQDNNVWITDVMLNKVFKFSPEGTLLLEVGDAYPVGLEPCWQVREFLTRLPCTRNPYHFARPTDVAVAADGSFFVSDGYRNARIAHFAADGTFLAEWGQLGDELGELYLPHGLALSQDSTLLVADRRNARLQLFATTGTALDEWRTTGLGRPFGVEVGPDGLIYTVDGGDDLDVAGARPRSQVVVLDSQGNIVTRWGWYDEASGSGVTAHDVAVGPDGAVYVATLNGQWLYKFVPEGGR